MTPSQLWLFWQSRGLWTDPVRRLRTLDSFAETEADGGKDLLAAAKRVSDEDLRGHLLRHARDEVRHADAFRGLATEVRAQAPVGAAGLEGPDKPYDLSRGRPGEVDAHGFFTAGLFEELGEISYVAMLHVAEERAREVFEVHRDLNRRDPRTREIFEAILKDEKYHVAYTKKILDDWKKEGREREVRQALRAARSSRFLGAWKRLGVRSAGGFGRGFLYVLYWTLLAPFGLLSRGRRNRPGLVELVPAPDPRAAVRSQY